MIKAYYQDNLITELHGHVISVLQEMPSESVHCIVTSPPYWGLRDYNLEPQIWDGEDGCVHEWKDNTYTRNTDLTAGAKQKTNIGAIGRDEPVKNSFCQKCGAWLGSLGLEPTPELYIQHIVQIWRELKRVLRKDGVCFLNIGDSYASSGKGNDGNEGYDDGRTNRTLRLGGRSVLGLKPKDLCMIPARVALALQKDGWWLRSDIIWEKSNPMPESCTDRPTNSYEHIFLLTKLGKYFYDADAVREEGTGRNWAKSGGNLMGQGIHKLNDGFTDIGDRSNREDVTGRNLRNVWTIATEPTPEAHFATFPQELVKKCILAGTSEKGCCPECGAPWVRVVEKPQIPRDDIYEGSKFKNSDENFSHKRIQKMVVAGRKAGLPHDNPIPQSKTIGWKPSCSCGNKTYTTQYKRRPLPSIPCTVLDPFSGSGKTLIVSKKYGRKSIGIDLKQEYLEMPLRKVAQEKLF